jgi:hypothetical protein
VKSTFLSICIYTKIFIFIYLSQKHSTNLRLAESNQYSKWFWFVTPVSLLSYKAVKVCFPIPRYRFVLCRANKLLPKHKWKCFPLRYFVSIRRQRQLHEYLYYMGLWHAKLSYCEILHYLNYDINWNIVQALKILFFSYFSNNVTELKNC